MLYPLKMYRATSFGDLAEITNGFALSQLLRRVGVIVAAATAIWLLHGFYRWLQVRTLFRRLQAQGVVRLLTKKHC